MFPTSMSDNVCFRRRHKMQKGHYMNALTIDVEDYWSIISRDWLKKPDELPTQAVVNNTQWFLQILGEYNVKATFFILGEVARQFPALVKEIYNLKHEIGVHGFWHRQLFKLTPAEFKKEISDCKKMLEDLTGQPVVGHRAPAFSIVPCTKWAFDVLCEAGFSYDSSVFPISGKRYGWPDFPKNICSVKAKSGTIAEAPMTTFTMLGKSLPAAGGGYLRHFPYFMNRIAIRRIQKTRPVIVYMHPYEIELSNDLLDMCHLNEKEKKKLQRMHKIQLRNRHSMKGKIKRLLSDFEFTTLNQVVKNQNGQLNCIDLNQTGM